MSKSTIIWSWMSACHLSREILLFLLAELSRITKCIGTIYLNYSKTLPNSALEPPNLSIVMILLTKSTFISTLTTTPILLCFLNSQMDGYVVATQKGPSIPKSSPTKMELFLVSQHSNPSNWRSRTRKQSHMMIFS